MNKKFVLIGLLFLLAISSGCIQLNNQIKSPVKVIVIKYYYVENSSGIIDMYGQGHDYTLFVPVSDSYQTINDLNPINITVDKYGNRKTTVNGPYNFSFSFKIGSTRNDLKDYPYPFTAVGYEEFLGTTDKIDPKNPTITEISKNLTSGKSTALQVIGSINNWTHAYLTYTLSEPRDLNTEEILETKAGRCEEFSRLYTAIARASGIPTRIVIGWVNANGTLDSHMWAESYVPSMGWVYVDPSAPEYGTMSQTHIKLYAGPDKLAETYYGNLPTRGISLNLSINSYMCTFDKVENCTLSSVSTLSGVLKE